MAKRKREIQGAPVLLLAASLSVLQVLWPGRITQLQQRLERSFQSAESLLCRAFGKHMQGNAFYGPEYGTGGLSALQVTATRKRAYHDGQD